MKFTNLSLYTIVLSLLSNLATVAVANEVVDESQIFKLPTNTDSLETNTSSQLLFSDVDNTGDEIAESSDNPEDQENAEKEEDEEEEEYTLSPLQIFPFEPMTVETANILPPGALDTNFSAILYPTGSQGSGLGLQVYNIGIDYGVTDQFQIGADLSFFDDALSTTFNGEKTDFGFFSLAPSFKYKFVESYSYSVAVVGSVEWLKVTSQNGLFNRLDVTRQDNTAAGTIQVPLTYDVAENAQWHLVGGLAIFPDRVNGGEFYGTFFNIGTGVSFKFAERFGFFADLNVPLGPGDNSVSRTGKVGKDVVWSAGLNYLHSPNVGLDVSVTNRLGNTPATKLLTFLPNGDEIGVGVNVRYSPDIGQNYQGSFRVESLPPMSDREKQLVFNNIILSSATTIRKGMFLFDGGIGPSVNTQLSYGMSDNAQLSFIAQQLSDSNQPIGNSTKLGGATKFNFLDQYQGDPFSLGVRGAFQEASGQEDGVGSFAGGAAFVYSANDAIAFTFNPKAGLFGDNRILGAGLGINLQPLPGFQLIGEVTPMISNDPTVWAAGARYMPPSSNVGVGVYGTNAAGTSDIGSIIRQSDSDISVGVNIMFLLGGGN